MPNIQNGNLLVSQDLKNSTSNSYYFGTQHAGEVVEVNLNFTSNTDSTETQNVNTTNSIKINATVDDDGFVTLDRDSIEEYVTVLNGGSNNGSTLESFQIYSGNSSVESLLTVPEVLLEESFESMRSRRGRVVLDGEVEGDNGTIWNSDHGIEVQSGILAKSTDGKNHIELDATENTTMTTTVELTDSDTYVVTFDVNPRSGGSSRDFKESSDMEISFGNSVVAIDSDRDGNLTFDGENENVTIASEPLDNGWTQISITYNNVDADSVELSLAGTGESNNIGMFVDNIKVVTPAQDDTPADETPTQEDAPADETPTQDDAPADETPAQDDAPADETPAQDDAPQNSDMEQGRDSDNFVETVTYDNDENCEIDNGREVDVYLATNEADRIDADADLDGSDNDKILFRDSDEGVTVNLETNENHNGDAEGDEYVNFEGVTGSLHDDDITGDSGANTLQGGEGDDVVDGGAGSDWIVETTDNGSDTIDGGAGEHDTVAYYVNGDVVANLETGENNQGDTLTNVENLSSHIGNDTLTGDAKDNVLKGNGGEDTLSGGAGDDIIAGGADNDTIDGGEGEDKIILNGYPHDYEFTQNDDGSVTVTDLRVGDANLDGTDTVTNVENVEFQYKDDSCVNHFDIVTMEDAINGNIDSNLGEITYSTDGFAEYANAVGFYKPNEDGTPELGKLLVDDQHTLEDGDHLAFVTPNDYSFFIIANGADEISKDSKITFDNSGDTPILLVDGVAIDSPIYFSNPDLNPGGRDHFKLELDGNGGTTIKIEDLDLGDADFDDVVMHTDFEMTDFGYDPINTIGGTDNNDWINSTIGNDEIDGGDGEDTVAYARGNDINANLETGVVLGDGNDTLSNIENIATANGNDTVVGSSEANRITTNGGDDTISAGDGNDIINAGKGNDTIDGGADIDKVILQGEPTDYEFVLNDNGSVTVTDLRGDSVDTLTSIENVEFRYTDVDGVNHFDVESMASALINHAPEGESYEYINDGIVGATPENNSNNSEPQDNTTDDSYIDDSYGDDSYGADDFYNDDSYGDDSYGDDSYGDDSYGDDFVPQVLLEESFENLQSSRGWHVEHGEDGIVVGDHGVVWDTHQNGIEVQQGIISKSSDGNTHAELDAHGSNSNVHMTTDVALTDSLNYTMSFDIKPRPGRNDTSDMDISLDGRVITIDTDKDGNLTIDTDAPNTDITTEVLENGWTKVTVEYTALDSDNAELVINGTGAEDTLGMLLDNIRLVESNNQDFVEPEVVEPEVIDGNVITSEDTTYTFTLDNFNSDANEVTIESLPSNGKIYLGDEEITSNTTVSANDINAGKLTFIANENESGRDEYNSNSVGDQQNDYAKFTFSINGSTTTATMNIDVTPIADSANLSVEGTTIVGDVVTSIDTSNVTDTSNGYRVTAFDTDGNQTDISTIIGTNHDGFGVQSLSRPDGANPGAITEINYYEGVGSEYVKVEFDHDVSTTNVSFAWKHSSGNVGGHQGETAVVEFYKDGQLLDTMTHNGGSDKVDGPFTFQTSTGEVFDEMRFSSLSLGDDYIIHDISYESATTTSSEELLIDAGNSISLDISSSLIDTDGSESIVNLSVNNLVDGMTLTDGTNTFTATADDNSVDVLSWNLDSLELKTSDSIASGDYDLSIVATTQESLEGSIDNNNELTKDTEVAFKVIVDKAIVDNTPTGEDEVVNLTFAPDEIDTNVTFVVDVSSSMSDNDLSLTEDAIKSLISQYDNQGNVNVNIIQTWGSANHGAELNNGLDVSGWGDENISVNLITDASGTDFDQGLKATMANYQSSDANDVVYFFADGNTYNDGAKTFESDFDATLPVWKDFVETNNIEVHTIGVNTSGGLSDLEAIGNVATNSIDTIYVDDISDLSDVVSNISTIPTTMSVSGTVSDNISGGDGEISFDTITIDDVTYDSTNFPADGVETSKGALLKFDFETGDYTYTASSSVVTEDITETFSVTASDEDGDSVSMNVNVNVEAPQVVVEPQTPEVDEVPSVILTDLGGAQDGQEVTFKITGDHYDPNNVQDVGAGSPEYQIFVNDVLFTDANGNSQFTVNANRNNLDTDSDAQHEMVTLKVDGNIDTVAIKFVNDAWDGGSDDNDGDGVVGEDRNLVVDEVTIGGTINEDGTIDGGVTLQAEDTATTEYIASSGNDVSGVEVMSWNGTMKFNVPTLEVENNTPDVIEDERVEPQTSPENGGETAVVSTNEDGNVEDTNSNNEGFNFDNVGDTPTNLDNPSDSEAESSESYDDLLNHEQPLFEGTEVHDASVDVTSPDTAGAIIVVDNPVCGVDLPDVIDHDIPVVDTI
ncbi:Alkaline phosphatase [hydrothermal vent metagenome]|uniref:Alkaline phosphatase n=1 Tax=hydrothermal vent metagenome TaxID=652676 RepID=A0A1W1EL04_9ZZZZ